MINEEMAKKILSDVKMLLAIRDDDSDELLSFLIDDCVNLVLSYCRIEELPKRLESLIASMSVRMYRDNGYGQTDAPQTVSSISEGSRSVSYKNNSDCADRFLNSYKARLEPFRCRRGRVPSDLDRKKPIPEIL